MRAGGAAIPVRVALAAGAVFALSLGLRQAQPLFIGPLNSHTGIGYATISLAFGVAQLVWGVAQPLAGAVADRWRPRWVMIVGVALLAAANGATPFSGNAVELTLLIGVAAAAGAGAIGPAMLISAANRWIPEAKRSVTTGIINAGGSFGQFTIIPLAQHLIGISGWQAAMVMLGVVGLAAMPLVTLFTPEASAASAASAASGASTLGAALRGAVRVPRRHRSRNNSRRLECEQSYRFRRPGRRCVLPAEGCLRDRFSGISSCRSRSLRRCRRPSQRSRSDVGGVVSVSGCCYRCRGPVTLIFIGSPAIDAKRLRVDHP